MIQNVTPVILSFNEEPNIERTLRSLVWAQRVVLVDSNSTDKTQSIAKSFQNVEIYERKFDTHMKQWEFGIFQTNIYTKHVLTLDADMATPKAFVDELERAYLPNNYEGATIPIKLCYYGHPLAGSLCPSQLRLFQPKAVKIQQSGHTQEFYVDGPQVRFRSHLLHDDRKSIERWVNSQLGYTRLEAERIKNRSHLRFRDRLRATGLMPPVTALLAYLSSLGPLGGKRTLRYTLERTISECMIAMRVLDSQNASKNE